MENNISKSWQMGLKRINELGFKLSETQKITPSDGNCFFHCISDQCSQFTDHKEVRHQVVSSIYPMVDKNLIFWDESEYLDEWIYRMNLNGTFADHYAIQVAANLLFRDIVIIPTCKESAHIMQKYCLIKAAELRYKSPIYVLWFEEHVYGVGHYQSIKPSSENNDIINHYDWLLKNIEKSRVLSVSNSTILGCRNSEPQHIESLVELNEPVFNSSENSEIVVFVNDSKTDRKGCHVCKKIFMKNKIRKFSRKCKQYCHSFCVGKC